MCCAPHARVMFIVLSGLISQSRVLARAMKWSRIGYKVVLFTYRKLHMGFRLIPKSVTLSDLEWWYGHHCALFYTKRQLSERAASNSLKLNPYCWQQKCSLGDWSVVFSVFSLPSLFLLFPSPPSHNAPNPAWVLQIAVPQWSPRRSASYNAISVIFWVQESFLVADVTPNQLEDIFRG